MQRWEQRGLRPQLHLHQHAGEQSCPAPLPGARGRSAPLILPLPCLSQGSYKCGPCKSGFVGNQTSGCILQQSCSTPTSNPCDINGFCVFERNGEIACAVSGGRGQEEGEAAGCRGYRHGQQLVLPGPFPASQPLISSFFSATWAGLATATCAGKTRTSTATQTSPCPASTITSTASRWAPREGGRHPRTGGAGAQGARGRAVLQTLSPPRLYNVCACRTTAA